MYNNIVLVHYELDRRPPSVRYLLIFKYVYAHTHCIMRSRVDVVSRRSHRRPQNRFRGQTDFTPQEAAHRVRCLSTYIITISVVCPYVRL